MTNSTNFNPENFESCVNRAIGLIESREKQMTGEGWYWPIDTKSCRWAIEQKITNRESGKTMMGSAIEYVEGIEYQAEKFNGLR